MTNRNGLDVSETVDVTDVSAVNIEVNWILLSLYATADTSVIDRAFGDVGALYRGTFPGYRACDTPFHNLQHTLDVALATARLMAGYEYHHSFSAGLGAPLFTLGIVAALFHDCGYVRAVDDAVHCSGAELTQTRASHGGRFLQKYCSDIGMPDIAAVAPAILHFTGYELPVARIEVPTIRHRFLGSLLGSADIIAQMADRCYLEKCRNRLYPELLAGGIARKARPNGGELVVFESGDDVVMKTPRFYRNAMRRLTVDLGNCYHFAANVFGGRDPYVKRIRRNIRFAQQLKEKNDTLLLRRIAPCLKSAGC